MAFTNHRQSSFQAEQASNAPTLNILRNLLPIRSFHQPGKAYVSLAEEETRIVERFNERIVQGTIVFETVPCLCGSRDCDLLASADYYGIMQQTVLCVRCGLVWSSPRMSAVENREFYSSDVYRRLYSGSDYLEASRRTRYTPETGKHMFDAVGQIKPIGRGTRVLEIGAGGGWNLRPFQQAGAEVLGIDYSPSLVELGRQEGIPMREGGLETIAGRYDVIILSHILEHFLDPISALKQIAQHLAERGLIYVEVPNILNFTMGQLQSAHTCYFSPRTLRHTLENCGMQLLAVGSARGIHMFAVVTAAALAPRGEMLADAVAYVEVRAAVRRELFRERMRLLMTTFHLLPWIRGLRAPWMRAES